MTSALKSAVEVSMIDNAKVLKAVSRPLSKNTKFLKNLSKVSSTPITNIFEASKHNQNGTMGIFSWLTFLHQKKK
jgi:hypothetical protein